MINFIKKLFGLHIHNWGKFSAPTQELWKHYPNKLLEWKFVEFYKTYQVRYCQTCGKVDKVYV